MTEPGYNLPSQHIKQPGKLLLLLQDYYWHIYLLK